MTGAVVEFEGAGKHYGGLTALEGLDLSIPAGEVLGLLGHNGAGKTTAIKLIIGIIAPSEGRVRMLGCVPGERAGRSVRLQIGYLPESVSFYDQLTGREVLDYFARLKGAARRQRNELLAQVGLADAADRRVKTYSKGMRQRLGLAQALLGQPRLLLLDEPTVGLDPIGTRDFFAALTELRRQGTTVVLCSHVLPGIEGHVDRVAILGRGRLRALGTLDELRRDTGLPLVIRARGHWAAGFWEGKLAEQHLVSYSVNGTQLELAGTYESKMNMMRLLASESTVEDIEVFPPSLEALYAHYSEPSDTTGKRTWASSS